MHDTTLTLLGLTTSDDLPVTPDAYQPILRGYDGFLVRFNHRLTDLLYCSYIGSEGYDEYNAAYVVNKDCLWIVGETHSYAFPTTPNAIQQNLSGLNDGFVQYFAIDTTADTTSASHNIPLPADFTLRVFPNPFNPTTTLSFSLPSTSNVELVVHDVLGREVLRQALGRYTVGTHDVLLDGSHWASGLYFASLHANDSHRLTKLALVK